MLAALFAEAKKLGIDQEQLRNEIAPAVIKKRLSMASAQEVLRVIEHVTGRGDSCNRPVKGLTQGSPLHKYDSSKAGLIQELEDVARERWGKGVETQDFASVQKSLNAFVNANREIPTHYKMMSVTGLKAIKERIKEMNRRGESCIRPSKQG
ncbi:MAG: hypothetical protein HY998_08565, partial [candidate division NC10 bacterium]|nr:hypothetical protein [candidate division NC10 bacterium]